MNLPMNHPLSMLISAAQSGHSPMQAIQQMAANNPVMAQGARIIQGKTPEQLQQIAQNMASQRGIDLNQLINSLPIPRR